MKYWNSKHKNKILDLWYR